MKLIDLIEGFQMHFVQLKKGREKLTKNRHPWIFSGALDRIKAKIPSGSMVELRSSTGQKLGLGYYNDKSQISLRMMTYDPEVAQIDRDFLKKRIEQASLLRRELYNSSSEMLRLVCHDADQLPGLIIDRYGAWIVFQILTAGMEAMRSDIIDIIEELFQPEGIIERSDENIRRKEGLEPRKEIIKGDWPSEGIFCQENDYKLSVDLWNGHKTGLYLDQRDNRKYVSAVSKGRRVLNCFSYTGGFSVAALMGGASSVLSVDDSRDALEHCEKNIIANQLAEDRHEIEKADVFQFLREQKKAGKNYDLVILDPPKFASSSKTVVKACRGYKDLNRLALELLEPGGILVTFSCSGLISRDLFQKVVFDASLEAQCEAVVLKQLTQSEDHPIRLAFPESFYLKGLIAKKVEN